MLATILKWATGFSLREYLEAAAVAAIFCFVLWWDHTEIQKGRDECQAAIASATTQAQTKLDALRSATNPLVIQQHQLDTAIKNASEPPIPANSDCANLDLGSLRSAGDSHR